MDYDIALDEIKEIISKSKIVLEEVVVYLYNKFEKYSWIGIYIIEGDDLVLGPWSGERATEHTRIPVGKGICGSAAKTGKTEIIPDVNSDPRYLSCFISTKSEIQFHFPKLPQYVPPSICINLPFKAKIKEEDDFIVKRKAGDSFIINGWPSIVKFVK